MCIKREQRKSYCQEKEKKFKKIEETQWIKRVGCYSCGH